MQFVSLLLLVFVSCSVIRAQTSPYQNIAAKIFKDYDTGLRPVYNASTVINVFMRFGVIQLLDVDEVAQTISVVTYMDVRWRDDFLTWEPKDFDGVRQLHYPHDKVWKPDIILTNTPDLNEGPVMEKASTNVVISSMGEVTNAFAAVYKATCATDMTDFPYDKHDCYLEFGSWTYGATELDIFETKEQFQLPNSMKQVDSTEFDMQVTRGEKIVEWDGSLNDSFPIIRFHIKLQRKPLYYLINLVIPTTITCYVSFFGMFSPSSNMGERLEKAFLGITTLLAVSLLLLSVSGTMPVTSNAVPLMGWFLGVYILLIAVAIICTSIIMHIDVQGLSGRELSDWTRKWFLQRLGKLFWIHRAHENFIQIEGAKTKFTDKSFVFDGSNGTTNTKTDQMIRYLAERLNRVEAIASNLYDIQEKEHHFNVTRAEWSQLCSVLDRMCLIFFLVFSTVFTVGVLAR